MTINFERLDAAITHGFEHPEEFNMGTWYSKTDCGTTACLAGTAAVQAGWVPVWSTGDCGMSDAIEVRDPETGEMRAVQDLAAELLGLWTDGAGEGETFIFFAGDLDEVIRVRNRWAREAGVPERAWGEG